jgi:SAM-dependent methyltransferase
MDYDPNSNMVGGFSDNDGTIDFYLRINSLISKDSIVLDYGAGRASWFEDDECKIRHKVRLLKGKVKKLIACDLDYAVLENKASDEQIYLENGKLGVEQNSVDLIICDYVLEHVENVDDFFAQIDNSLVSGGWFCARTPHKYSYVSLAASLISNNFHSKVLRKVQPNRKEIDIFPTHYNMNTLKEITKAFKGWENKSFIFKGDPAYYFGSKAIYEIQKKIHNILPVVICGNLFVFLRKP